MGKHHCCMPGCTSDSEKGDKTISFHRIPTIPKKKNADGYKQWRSQMIHIVCRSDDSFNPDSDECRVCSLHFEPDCFNYGTKSDKKTLAFGSLPTKCLVQKSIVTPVIPPRKPPMARPCPPPVERIVYSDIGDIAKDAIKVAYPWALLNKTDKSITIGYVENNQIKIHVTIDEDMNTHLEINNFIVDGQSTNLQKIRLKNYLNLLSEKQICQGITQNKYQKYASVPTKTSTSNYYKHFSFTKNIPITSFSSIRSRQCQFLTNKSDSTLCSACKKSLCLIKKKQKRHIASNKNPTSKYTPLRIHAKKKLKEAVKTLRKSQKQLKQKLQNFRNTIVKDGVRVSSDMHKNMMDVINDDNIDDDLTKLFWKEQLKAFQRKKGGMRWHPSMIRLAILLHSRSPAVYDTLRESGILRLPGASTLRDYTAIIQPKCGRNEDILCDIRETTKHLNDNERYVILLHDEMSVKADLVYDPKSDEVIGFVNSDSWSYDNIHTKKLATHILLFFIVGVNTSISRSVMYFPTSSATSSELYAHFWEVVGELEVSCNLRVIASTSDKAAANQKMVRIQTDDNKTVNLFAPHRSIYFFSDAPHLLKTIRNNIFHSGAGKARLLWNDGKYIEWKHISDVYRVDSERELRRTKLTSDHINLTPHTVMNVKLAAQVLSHSVGVIMEAFGGDQCSETAKFIKLTDRFFDCLNVRSVYEAGRKLKDDLEPYRFTTDCRFAFLMDYLRYVEQWKESVSKRKGQFTKTQRKTMFLADQTFQGIKTTVLSAIECTRFLLNNGVEFVLTNKFCQDPLEAHFGRHRGVSGRANNPTIYSFGHQDKKLTIQRNMAMLIQPRGNVEKRKLAVTIRSSPMKKKRKDN